MKKTRLSRRGMLRATAAVTAAATIVPRHVLGQGQTPPSEKLNVAGVGIGGKGGSDLHCVGDENIVALCDVDDKYAAKVFARYPKATRYRDYRKMLETRKDIEGVVVATPDHTHAVIGMMCLKLKKHLYLQKPLAHTIHEVRQLTEAAEEAAVATQMGNQGHADEGIRQVCEMVWDGAVGPVREVHVWTNRPGPNTRGRYGFPVNIGRPEETPGVPEHLDWDLWLGPAPVRPYHPIYHPFSWRSFRDFGTGALGDMGCHILDVPFWALKLGHPTSVEATSTAFQNPKEVQKETFPMAAMVHYDFPARGDLPPVTMHWYDGGMEPMRPKELEDGRPMGSRDHGGILLVGDDGIIMSKYNGADACILPDSKWKDYKMPAKTIPRVPGGPAGHRKEWAEAAKTGRPTGSSFDYAGPLTEVVLLGCLATRMRCRLNWDAENLKVTNVPEANELIHKPYRQGWTL